jgi:two-component system response regulator (stage 0 sporulation protein A)
MPHFRVLISDNCEDYANLLSDCLSTNSDIEIVGIAEDGAKTINMLQSTTPDVLLLDLIMPNVDGFEVLRHMDIKDNSPTVLVMSALGNNQFIDQAMGLGAKHYFVKPFNPESVACKIRELSFKF